MKQVTQRIRDGTVELLDVPPPTLSAEGVLVDVRASLMSAGTERNKIATGRQSLIAKARSRPDQVRQVVDKARRDGLKETVEAVRSRLDQPSSIGYSAAGVVLAVGARVSDVSVGDRVAIGGGDHAVHAEIDHVPGNLVVKLPDSVPFEHGAFATVGSIALHGVRQADIRLAERVAVIGLGLVGQITGALLQASGCRVIGVDLSPQLVADARTRHVIDSGFARPELDPARLPPEAQECDAVIITAATSSDDPVELAAAMSRDRGRVVVVGDVGMDLPRPPFFGKELELRLSRSYGPGRYDREYEERGLDYPIGYVRWTERRNMAAFVELVAARRIDVESLITERIPVERAPEAYEKLVSSEQSPVGLVLTYGENELPELDAAAPGPHEPPIGSARMVNVVGAGSFAQRVLIPAFRQAGFTLNRVASATGLSARAAADRFGFVEAVEPERALGDPEAGVVVVATRHASHASLARTALEAGKAVFVEKPPALSSAELERLRRARDASGGRLFVGFNRRHARLAGELRRHVSGRGLPIELLYRVNAGVLPHDHWLNDLADGGGRLAGEGCHFVDFACWVVGAVPERVSGALRPTAGEPLGSAQSFSATLEFGDRSLATVLYTVGGAAKLGKEYVEAHSGGRSAILDDFRQVTLVDSTRRRRITERSRDKGHARQVAHMADVLAGRSEHLAPDPLDTMAATLAVLRSAETGSAVRVDAVVQGEAAR